MSILLWEVRMSDDAVENKDPLRKEVREAYEKSVRAAFDKAMGHQGGASIKSWSVCGVDTRKPSGLAKVARVARKIHRGQE